MAARDDDLDGARGRAPRTRRPSRRTPRLAAACQSSSTRTTGGQSESSSTSSGSAVSAIAARSCGERQRASARRRAWWTSWSAVITWLHSLAGSESIASSETHAKAVRSASVCRPLGEKRGLPVARRSADERERPLPAAAQLLDEIGALEQAVLDVRGAELRRDDVRRRARGWGPQFVRLRLPRTQNSLAFVRVAAIRMFTRMNRGGSAVTPAAAVVMLDLRMSSPARRVAGPTTYEVLVRGELSDDLIADLGARRFEPCHGKTADLRRRDRPVAPARCAGTAPGAATSGSSSGQPGLERHDRCRHDRRPRAAPVRDDVAVPLPVRPADARPRAARRDRCRRSGTAPATRRGCG